MATVSLERRRFEDSPTQLPGRTPAYDRTAPTPGNRGTMDPINTPMTGLDYQAPLTQAYQTSLGRAPGAGEVDRWWNMLPGNLDERIRSLSETQEAKNYAARPGASQASSSGSADAIIRQWQQTHSPSEGLTGLIAELQRQGVNASPFMYGETPSGNEISLNGQQYKVLTGNNQSWWDPSMGEGVGGNVFSDPATAGWESLLRSMTERLNTPQQTPGYDNLVQYLNQYMQTLQGPAYTPGQSELIQTQALDPMTQTRDAQRQDILRQASARGLNPTSGPIQQQLQDLERNYGRARTQVQSGFATNAIGLEKSQQAQAAQVGQMLQALEQGQLTGNEDRAMQAVSLMGQIPALADSRLGAANQTLSATNAPLATILSYILNQQGQGQQQRQFDAQQNAAYWKQIGDLLGGIFG